MKKVLVFLASILLCCYANAQNNKVNVALKFLDSNPDLARSVSGTLSSVFSAFYASWNSDTPPDLSDLHIAANTKDKIITLWNRHKFRLAGLSCVLGTAKIQGENEYAAFSIPMQVEGSSNVEEYTVQFDSRGVITNFEKCAFPILNFQTGKRVTDEKTKNIIKVILYQLSQAYDNKDMDYLRKIYDPEGYCITGKRASTTTSNGVGQEMRIQLEHTYYELTIKKLHQYLDDLKRVFAANALVDVDFVDPEITAHQNPNPAYDGIYYINMLQKYSSSNYKDEGWLTIVLDLRDKSNPQIMARIWLPDKITNEQLTSLF